MKKIFSRGDKATVALYVERGEASVTFDKSPGFTFPKGISLVASAECFLDTANPKRITDFYLSTLSETKKIPFYRVREQMQDYQFGFDTNRYLAQLLEFSNQHLMDRERAANDHHETIHRQAIVYKRIVNELNAIWQLQGSVEAYALANKAKSSPLFEYASKFEVDQSPTTIALPTGEDRDPFVQQFPKGSVICHQGEAGHELFALLQGKISVRRGKRLLAQISSVGEAFGELSLFLDGVRTASLTAEEDSTLLVVPRERLGHFFSTRGDFFLNVAGTLARRIEKNVAKIYELQEACINAAPEALERQLMEADKTEDHVYGLGKLVIHLRHLAKRTDDPALSNLYDDIMSSPDTAAILQQV